MRLTLSAMCLPVLALGAFMMQATPVFAQAAAPTTGPANAPANSAPVTAPSPAANGLPSASPSTAPTMTAPTTGTTAKTTHRMSMDARFKAANTTNDGNLTLDQAKAANWSYVTTPFHCHRQGQQGLRHDGRHPGVLEGAPDGPSPRDDPCCAHWCGEPAGRAEPAADEPAITDTVQAGGETRRPNAFSHV